MRIVQIVRRFGPVGGMEAYAWHLTRELAQRGMEIHVVCETHETDPIPGVTVAALGGTRPFPRWWHHLQFSRRVAKYRQQHGKPNDIWHSHECVTCVEIGTFHTTVHGAGESKAWPKRLDPTWHINQWLERRVINSNRLKRMVSVSGMVREQLAQAHLRHAQKFSEAISPGVGSPVRTTPVPTEPILGFIGYEWKRKGLPRVLEILRGIPDAQLVIAGVPAHEIEGLLDGIRDRVEILGGIDDPEEFYGRIRLLVHPAKLEAYGMVVAEALARQIPVLVSEATGASATVGAAGRALQHTAPVDQWIQAARELLANPPSQFPPVRTWREVAGEHAALYAALGD